MYNRSESIGWSSTSHLEPLNTPVDTSDHLDKH